MGLVITEEKMVKTAKKQSNLKYNRLWKVSNNNQILTDSDFHYEKTVVNASQRFFQMLLLSKIILTLG
jgi:hypothetical protein